VTGLRGVVAVKRRSCDQTRLRGVECVAVECRLLEESELKLGDAVNCGVCCGHIEYWG